MTATEECRSGHASLNIIRIKIFEVKFYSTNSPRVLCPTYVVPISSFYHLEQKTIVVLG